jgi:HAD superfamily hydrolase (TIGR01549 family)
MEGVLAMTIPLQITTLLFDLDGTLIHHHPSSLDVLFTILDQHSIPLLVSAHRDTLQFIFQYWANSNELQEDLDMFGEFTDEFWLHYLKRKMWAAGLTEMQTAEIAEGVQEQFAEMYQPETIVPDEVIPTLKTLRRKGYKMGLVSNRSSSVDEEIRDLGFDVYFDFFFTSGDIQIWKPDPGIFEHALYLAESSPEATAYIGDNYYTDVVGAKNAGLYPILYDPRNIFPDADCQVISSIAMLLSQIS